MHFVCVGPKKVAYFSVYSLDPFIVFIIDHLCQFLIYSLLDYLLFVWFWFHFLVSFLLYVH